MFNYTYFCDFLAISDDSDFQGKSVVEAHIRRVKLIRVQIILRAILRESEVKLEMKNYNPPSFFVWM